MLKCRICCKQTDGHLRNGVVACKACKSFFLIHSKDNEILVCKTGLNNCDVEIGDGANSIISSNGCVWRFACGKCRFAKCISIGMRRKQPKTPSNLKQLTVYNGSSPGIDTTQPSSNVQDIKLDKDIETMILSFSEICGDFKNKFPSGKVFIDSAEMIATVNEMYTFGIQKVVQFIKTLPSYGDISLTDRMSIFTHSLTGIGMFIQSATMNATLGFNPNHLNELKKYFPLFEVFFVFVFNSSIYHRVRGFGNTGNTVLVF